MVRESKQVKPADNPFFYMPQCRAGTPAMGVQSPWAGVLNNPRCPRLNMLLKKKSITALLVKLCEFLRVINNEAKMGKC